MSKLWIMLGVVALFLAVYCFHLHEERHRFVKVGELDSTRAVIVMFDRRTRDLCVASLPSESMKNASSLCSKR